MWIGANLGKWWRTGEPGMLQSMGVQRVGHNLATEQQQWRAKCKTREKGRIIHGGCASRKTGHWVKENLLQKLQSWKEYHREITGNSNRSWSTPSNSILFFWLALLRLFPYFQQGVLHTFSKTLDREGLHGSDVTETILSFLFSNMEKASPPAKGNSSHMFSQPRPSCSLKCHSLGLHPFPHKSSKRFSLKGNLITIQWLSGSPGPTQPSPQGGLAGPQAFHLNWKTSLVANHNQVNLQLTTITLLWERSWLQSWVWSKWCTKTLHLNPDLRPSPRDGQLINAGPSLETWTETQKLVEALTLMVLWYPPAAEGSRDHRGDGGEVPGCFQVWTWPVSSHGGGSGALWDTVLRLPWAPSSSAGSGWPRMRAWRAEEEGPGPLLGALCGEDQL